MYSGEAGEWGCKKPEPDADVCPASVSSEEISTGIVEDYLELLKPFVQQIDKLNTRIKELVGGIIAVEDLIRASHGVDGLHLNGDIAPWDELRTGGVFEEWLIQFDKALKLIENE